MRRLTVFVFAVATSAVACASLLSLDDAKFDGACAQDLTQDSHNCGACGHDCFGGACSNSACAPYSLVGIDGGDPYALARYKDDLLVLVAPVEAADGGSIVSIYQCPLDGAACTTSNQILIIVPGASQGILADDAGAYVTHEGHVESFVSGSSGFVPSGAVATIMQVQGAEASAFALSDLYFLLGFRGATDGGSDIYRVHRASGVAEKFAHIPDQVFALAYIASNDELFIGTSDTPGAGQVFEVTSATADAGNPKQIWDGGSVYWIASSGDTPYWPSYGSSEGLVTIQNGVATPVAGIGNAVALVLTNDGKYVYVSTDVGSILRLDTATWMSTIVSSTEVQPSSIVVDDTRVYWVDRSVDGSTGHVRALALP
jgi:hypothetical protein